MLEIKDLKVNYGGIEALKGISFHVEEGEIVTLIGANGAGKSTTLRSIMEVVKPASGTITFQGEDITGMNTQKIVDRGIVLVPEGRRVFPNLTVLENLRIGAYLRTDKAGIDKDLHHVYSLFPRLEERHWQLAGTLSGGEQQMLAVGRALMGRPKILLLDEPSMGLAPVVVAELFEKIVDINRKLGMTILLVEQNSKIALKNSDYAYVIEEGKITMEGESIALRDDPRIRQAYLGKFAK